ncbi:Type II secretion system protein F [Alienimonas californiensis]|uniref:Type II secretion system protein F n=2 Tax=Alienimonas californiensis TaxID=2527989 RepID=A0A517PDS0_9PLAN|nr:Type II secretion system protein F [Alienimonas californiensis]
MRPMFSRRLPLATLARLCRSLATLLDSGVTLTKALSVAGSKSGDHRLSKRLAEVTSGVKRGEELHVAFAGTEGAFPRLFLELVQIAEGTGHLPEVLRSLADHYDNLLRLKKAFLAQIAWPIFQLAVAVLVIGFVIWLLGQIGDGETDTLGLGLIGGTGAAIWFGTAGALVGGGVLLYQLGKQSLRWRRSVDAALLRVPVIGGCLQNFALARFSWAFALTQNAGMDVRNSLTASLNATENGAYAAAAPQVWAEISAGGELTEALASTHLFPAQYLSMVDVAEASGSVPEMLDRISPDLEADARRSLTVLSAAVGWLVWSLVAGFIIFLIFSIIFRYLSMLDAAASGNLDAF